MNESGEAKAAESDDEALTRLTSAIGQPPLSVTENAKALFASVRDDDHAQSDDSVSAVTSAPADPVRG